MTGQFWAGYAWRFVFTDLSLTTTSWAQNQLSNRRIVTALGEASVIEADIDPDSFLVNGLMPDGYPRVNRSNRICFAFRRSGPDASSAGFPWHCEAAGILMGIEDQGDADVPLSHFTAYDPRKLLEGRPLMDEDGELLRSEPVLVVGEAAEIGLQYLANTINSEGGVFIDAGPDWGGTADWGGVIETTETLAMEVSRDMTVADLWNQLEETGKVEFVLRPIYDPTRFVTVDGIDYYFTHELSAYVLAGQERPSAVFSWGRLNYNVEDVSRMQDATPGAFFNKVLYYAGAGGRPYPLLGPSVGSGTVAQASIDDFGVYWQQQYFPNQGSANPSSAAVLTMAQLQIKLVKQGRRTLNVKPITERAPIPLDEYELGDRVKLYVSRATRQITEGYQRVMSIPFEIQDEGAYEVVNTLVVTPDWPVDEGS